MRALVTGCAGFIGSHLSERLLALGHEVVGVDNLTPFYDPGLKLEALAALSAHDSFEHRHVDLSREPLGELIDSVDAVYHLAGEPGVRQSFEHVAPYRRNNVIATRRLLAAAARRPLEAFVYASSSSVYGDRDDDRPMHEDDALAPVSPYAHTKVEVERLADDARARHGVPAVGLRFFSVYGPRQRPDMAFQRFLERAAEGRTIAIYGDGTQRRDFTYVGDAVDATIAATGAPRAVYNVGGGHPTSLTHVLALVGELLERELTVEHRPAAPGDVRRTLADTARARDDLGFAPRRELAEGVALQLDWLLARQPARAAAA
jgi:nucleoside-diphosphate-sugar epimerase